MADEVAVRLLGPAAHHQDIGFDFRDELRNGEGVLLNAFLEEKDGESVYQ